MLNWTVFVHIGNVGLGLGLSGSATHELRLGFFRVGFCRGSLTEALDKYRALLRAAVRGI